MPDVLRIAVGVATPLSLLGLVVALAYFIYSRRLKHREALITLLPEEVRAKEVDELLTRYNVDAGNLSRQQKFQLILDEMRKRYRLALVRFIVSGCVFAVCFVIAAYAFIRLGSQPAPPDNSKTEKLLERGIPQDEHPVIKLDEPIEQQVQLFPEDKVKIVGVSEEVEEVWFGNRWEPFQPDKTYTVWGTEGQPVFPRFKGRGSIKLEISYTRYREFPRDKRPDDWQVNHRPKP